jgi:hypothetical protein
MDDLVSYELPTVSADQLDPKDRQAAALGVVFEPGDVMGTIYLSPEKAAALVR